MESTKDEVSIPVQQEQTDAHLDDDRQPQEGQFVGATLKIDGDLAKDEHEVRFSGQAQTEPGSGFDRNRPGSTIGRQSVRSTSSRTSLRPGGYISPKTSDKFFSYKVKLQSMKWFVFSTVKQSNPVFSGPHFRLPRFDSSLTTPSEVKINGRRILPVINYYIKNALFVKCLYPVV